MQVAILLVLAVVGAVVCLKWLFPANSSSVRGGAGTRRSGGTLRTARGTSTRANNPFHAVSVRSAAESCEAVRDIKRTRFLSSEAPVLPLAGCTAKNCRCRYTHHIDRRRGDGDRRLGFGMRHELSLNREEVNRRCTKGRRQVDLVEV